MDKNSKIYVAGHRGLVGSAIMRRLQSEGYGNVVVRTSAELDLTRQTEVEDFFREERPEYVFVAAAKVGGIHANIANPASFIYVNLLIQSNVVHSAYISGTKKLLFGSSSCSYPRQCRQPMREEDILSGPLEPTNEPFAVAKIAGMKMIEAYHKQYKAGFFSLVFPNIYGPGDNFDLASSHVIAALIRKVHTAAANGLPEVEIWGTGNVRREFLYVDDVADACVYFMDRTDGGEILNVGAGRDITIRELATLICETAGYEGRLVFDSSKPEGMAAKLLDISSTTRLGWRPRTSLREGLRKTLQWYKANQGPEDRE